jgi:hypothetical protein
MHRLSPFAVALVLGVAACSPNSAPTDKGKAGKQEPPPPPCHPGCFPAGTAVATPEGPRPIEAIARGDVVTLVGPDGTPTSGTVHATFQTWNRPVEVRTESGNLLTTETQPLCLHAGGFRPAGELAAGDRIWRWEGGERRPARVRAVVPTGRETPVFNLVVGESAVFVADGFLARGKPPPAAGSPPGVAE